MMYNVLRDGYLNKMVCDENGITCEALANVTREVNSSVTSINTKAKVLAFNLAKVKAEGLWQKGAGWDSYEAYCREWNISKSDASRLANVGALLTKAEDGRLVSQWAKKTVDFTYAALVELVTVDAAQVSEWLEDGTLTLAATVKDCRKAKKMLKAASEPEAKEAEASEAEANEAEVTVKEPATVSGAAYANYAEALAALKALAGDNADLIAAIGLVDEAVQAMFKAGAPAITTAA